jgi:hypothetical protein
MTMAKGRGGRGREPKKPKAGNKPVKAGTGFLPLQSPGVKAPVKDVNK